MKRTVTVSAALAAVLLCIAQLFAMHRFSSLQCDMVIEHPQTGRTEGKLYMKGDMSRAELSVMGQDTVTIMDGNKAYSYAPEQGFAISISISQAKEQVPDVKDYETDCQGFGSELIDGRDCGVYQCMKGQSAVKIWVAKDIDFPVKVYAAGATTYYKNIKLNAAIDDSLFALPEGIKVQDMSQMMQGAAGMDISPDDVNIGSAGALQEDEADYNPKDDDYVDINRQ